MLRLLPALLALLFALGLTAPAQGLLHVPAGFPTIQSAVDAALPGETVVVAPGVYAQNPVVMKPITVRSSGGASVTLITDSGEPTANFKAGAGAMIEGFSMVGGRGVAGIAPVAFRRCVVRDAVDTGLTLTQAALGDLAVVESCVICDNQGADGADGISGGATPCTGQAPEVGRPGGLLVVGTPCVLLNTMITRNVGGDAGASSMSPTCPDTVFGGAGAVEIALSETKFYNCTIANNVGGNGTNDSGPLDVVSGHALLFTVADVLLQSSIVTDNTLPVIRGLDSFLLPSVLECSASNIRPAVVQGFQCIEADPLFVDPQNGDYRLSAGSPCIDTGIQAYGNVIVEDAEGNPRLMGLGVDMGADEFVTSRPGTMDGFTLTTSLSGRGEDLDAKVARAGDQLLAEIAMSPGVFHAAPVLLSQAFVKGAGPVASVIPELHVDLAAAVVLFDGNALSASQPGFAAVGTQPFRFGPIAIPPGLAGLVLRLQSVIIDPAAQNGVFAATRAIDHHFVD